jgi:NAD-dependent SIR2 family protein deacetylase
MARFRSGTLPSELYGTGYRTIVKIIEVNAEPTPLTQEGISDYLIQGKTGEILPRIVEQVRNCQDNLEPP